MGNARQLLGRDDRADGRIMKMQHVVMNAKIPALWRGFIAGIEATQPELAAELRPTMLDDLHEREIIPTLIKELGVTLAGMPRDGFTIDCIELKIRVGRLEFWVCPWGSSSIRVDVDDHIDMALWALVAKTVFPRPAPNA